MRAIVPLARVANTFVSGAIRRFVRPKQVANCSYAGQRTRAFSGTRADALDGDPDHLLLSLVREKVAVKAIAEKLGLSEGAVHRKVARLVSVGKVSAPAQHDSGDSLLDVDEDASTFVLRKSCEGRVVLNHSTHCDDLIPALEKLAEYEGIKTITPGRLKRVGGHVGFLNLKVAAAKCSGGFRLTARRGTTVQEVFVTCASSLTSSMLQRAIDEVLQDFGGGRRL